jgi:AcrR family transcriptional regulator
MTEASVPRPPAGSLEVRARPTRRSPNHKLVGGSRAPQKTFERIQSAALWLFAVKGVDSSSIREIGARAKVPTSLLYHYAPSKLQILFELMDDGIKRHLNSSRQARNLGTTPEGELIALVAAHVQLHGKNRLMARVVNHEWRALPRKQQAVISGLRDEISALWDATLVKGVQEQVFDIQDVKLARLALIEMCSGVSTWFSASGPTSIEALATDYADLALGMVRATRNGRPVRFSDVPEPRIEQVAHVVLNEHIGAVRETRL